MFVAFRIEIKGLQVFCESSRIQHSLQETQAFYPSKVAMQLAVLICIWTVSRPLKLITTYLVFLVSPDA
jgi:hypothetical protein